MRKLLLPVGVLGLLLRAVSALAAGEESAKDINEYVVTMTRQVSTWLASVKATEIAVVPFKGPVENVESPLSEVLTNELLQELRFSGGGVTVRTTGDAPSTQRVSGTWEVEGENVKITTRIVQMPAGSVEVKFVTLVPVRKVPKVYLSQAQVGDVKPDKGTRIAILPFKGAGENFRDIHWLEQSIPEAMTTYFAKNSSLVLIEGLQVDKIYKELDLAESKYIDPDTAVRAGSMMQANYVVLGSYTKLGRKIRLQARRVKVLTGEIFEAADAVGSENDLFELQTELAKSLLADIQRFY